MNAVDKETLLDLYITLKEIRDEIGAILYMEAPTEVYERARKSWLQDIEMAIGDKQNTNTFQPTFWSTLEELGFLDVQGTTKSLFDDEGDDEDEDTLGEEDVSFNTKPQSKEDEDEEQYDEVVYDDKEPTHVDPNNISSLDPNLSSAKLVAESPIVPEKKVSLPLSTTNWDNNQWKDQQRFAEGSYIRHILGDQEYYSQGRYHREDGPAIIRRNGDKFWYRHGKLHCLDGPAIELVSGHKEWWVDGKLHRWDGSAIEHSEGVSGKGYALYGYVFDTKSDWDTAKTIYSLKMVSKKSVLALPPASPSSSNKLNLPPIYG